MSFFVLIERKQRSRRRGFTLVEMLVAMAVTLLMMAALARAFGFVGAQVRDSRANLQLTGELRDVTMRINDELRRCTVSLEPNDGGPDQSGYLLYYEGPVTDVTSSIFRATTDADGKLDLPDSRYGDFDDYLAFTAVAPPNTWFTGKVPRYLLEAKSAEVKGMPFSRASTDPAAFEPVVIKSKYAEIIYFASPEYDESTLGTATPRYVDVDGELNLGGGPPGIENGLPDRLRIYRRVLLIRPDLNVNPSVLTVGGGSDLVVVATDPPHLPRLPHPGTPIPFMQTDVYPTNWQVAMAAAHQQCDLSIRRVPGPNGLPTNRVAANSLADLAKPQNRFAHVRIPNASLGVGAGDDTSMPVLALGLPATILSVNNQNGDRIAPSLAPPSNDPVVTPADWCGFLRPEFVLGHDYIHADPGDAWWSRSARRGEDLLVNNAMAFDVQIYDSAASWIADAGSGLVVGPTDAGYREVLNAAVINLGLPADASRVTFGGFVDLAYPTLAGGSLRGWGAGSRDRRSGGYDSNAIPAGNYPFLDSEYSGLRSVSANAASAYQLSLFQSGHLVLDGSNRIRLYQPTFDTYTSSYERDGFLQDKRFTTPNFAGTIWTTNTDPTVADLGANGLDETGTLPGADDPSERETSAPFTVRPEAIRVTVRLENPSTRQVRQSSVVHRDDR